MCIAFYFKTITRQLSPEKGVHLFIYFLSLMHTLNSIEMIVHHAIV